MRTFFHIAFTTCTCPYWYYVKAFSVSTLYVFHSTHLFLANHTMLTQKSQQIISVILTNSCYFKILPFDWNPKTYTLTVITGSRFLITLPCSAWVWVNFVYLWSTLYYHPSRATANTSTMLHTMWGVCNTICSIFTFSNLRQRYEIAVFFNQFFRFQKLLDGKWDEFQNRLSFDEAVVTARGGKNCRDQGCRLLWG